MRQNRWLFTASLTQKVSDESSAIVSIKWADHPEFLGEVDKRVTANVGVSFKIPNPIKTP